VDVFSSFCPIVWQDFDRFDAKKSWNKNRSVLGPADECRCSRIASHQNLGIVRNENRMSARKSHENRTKIARKSHVNRMLARERGNAAQNSEAIFSSFDASTFAGWQQGDQMSLRKKSPKM
jgi:hypothetical protein